MAKTTAKVTASAGTGAAASGAGKSGFKIAKNRLGFVSKSKSGTATLLTVEQDMVLKAGDRLIMQKPSEEVDSLVRNGILSEEDGESRKERIPAFKLYNVNLLPKND